jgi:hypothetical protein
MKKEAITFLGVGDIVIDREKPETIFQHTAPILRAAGAGEQLRILVVVYPCNAISSLQIF